MKYPLVLVEWNDAVHLKHGWSDDDLATVKHVDDVCYSVGWMIRQDDKSLTLAQTDGLDTIANTLQLPMAMIKKVTQIKVPR
jgi:hypothetical protein